MGDSAAAAADSAMPPMSAKKERCVHTAHTRVYYTKWDGTHLCGICVSAVNGDVPSCADMGITSCDAMRCDVCVSLVMCVASVLMSVCRETLSKTISNRARVRAPGHTSRALEHYGIQH